MATGAVLCVVAAALAAAARGSGEWTEDAEDLVSTVDVDAVLGRTASLPCDVTPYSNEDRVYMVLWFRKSGGKPIFSFDVRGRPFGKALQWSDPGGFGPRASFSTAERPAALALTSVQLDDEGVYRCRVDYKNSPTRNFQIRLSVIVPPHQMMVYDKSGADVTGVIGPLEEGASLVLVCEVRGGRPEPTVSWLINDAPAPQYLGVKTDTHVMVTRLELARLRREDLNTTFRCRAVNTPLVPPQEKALRLEMNLAPLSATLLSRPPQLVAGSAVTLRCISEGSRPPAHISWYKDSINFEKEKISEQFNETWSTSSLVFKPAPEDHGSTVRCVASNPVMPAKNVDDSVQLNVVYSPQVTLSLGSTLNPNEIKEGDDVYFECNVRANPREHRISWYHNERPVAQNMSSGVILSTRSLVLQSITRREAGLYACRAANARGETSSHPVKLRVQFAPVCASAPQVVGAAPDEALRVRCAVLADPADVSFVWQFNNSGESFHVSNARHSTVSGRNGSTSELRYTPASERDYGALSCRGSNAVGSQVTPCVFQVVPAARPSPPRNCSITSGIESNGTETVDKEEDKMAIRCVAGYDGGLPQTIVLEALDPATGIVKFNTTTTEIDGVAVFTIPVLALWTSDNALRLTIHSRNDKGASERISLNTLAYQDPEPRTDGTTTFNISKAALWTIVATAATCLCAVAAVVYILRKRKARVPAKMQPELQINAGDRQYVVAYTLKPPRPTQPDILNPPPDGEAPGELRAIEMCSVEESRGEDHWARGGPEPHRDRASYEDPYRSLLPSTKAPGARALLADDLPGPESCV